MEPRAPAIGIEDKDIAGTHGNATPHAVPGLGLRIGHAGDIDPMLTMEYIKTVRSAYAGGADLSSPDLSPLLGDCSGFPPTLIQVGTYEILYSDAESLRDKLLDAHVPCTFQVYEEMWHVFQMFPLKKAAAAMNNVSYFLLEQQ